MQAARPTLDTPTATRLRAAAAVALAAAAALILIPSGRATTTSRFTTSCGQHAAGVRMCYTSDRLGVRCTLYFYVSKPHRIIGGRVPCPGSA